jgi:hypothetical protein
MYRQLAVQARPKNLEVLLAFMIKRTSMHLMYYVVSQNVASVHKSSNAALGSTAKSAAVAKGQKLSAKDKIPLIIVPAAPTAKFTLYNIKQFLEDQK